ncbi:tyrosyl-tRNA deacylase [Rhodanobacter denitrificans]|uniref:tyrosyl-tRNA deacylase n=1 Tax=Rhodanobacter denitrificans TaxID=666685 RepID=UPI0011C07357|nr:tyrosyl-tRNA deacylase [Rhodanobacter denitrificans]
MSTVPFQSNQEKLASDIDADVSTLLARTPFTLPSSSDSVVARCVVRILDSYDAANAKRDTDNAVDLLYIAYCATPQREAGIRVKISSIIEKLIKAQEKSIDTMSFALRRAREINNVLNDAFPTWLDIRQPLVNGEGTPEQIQELRDFVKSDLMSLAGEIAEKAGEVEKRLLGCAAEYDSIIENTQKATDDSQVALGAYIKERDELQREINQHNAQRAKLESLVDELGREVKKFEDKAKEFENRASTAEERSFVLSIIGAAASIVAAIVPPVALLASSGLIGSATQGAAGAKPKPKNPDQNEAQAKTELADKLAEQKKVQEDVDNLDKEITELKAKPKPDDDETAKKAYEERIGERQERLDAQKLKLAQLNDAVTKLQEGLDKAKQEFKQLSEQNRDQAASLREMQMQMLDKAEKYETERRTQAAELVRIKVLLEGQQTEDEKLQLAVRSLDLSIGSLKRMQEIVREIAFFFRSFANFMGEVSNDANRQLARFEATETKKLRSNELRSLVKSTDIFFVKQAANWHAVLSVSGMFLDAFKDGRTRMVDLDAKYLTGEKLKSFLDEAGGRLEGIAKEREKRASAKIYDLQNYREELQRDAG